MKSASYKKVLEKYLVKGKMKIHKLKENEWAMVKGGFSLVLGGPDRLKGSNRMPHTPPPGMRPVQVLPLLVAIYL